MNPLERVAARIGCTEGQLYSMVIALSATTGLILVSGVPLGDTPRAAAAPVAPPTSAPVVVPSPAAPTFTPSPTDPLPLNPLTPVQPEITGPPLLAAPVDVPPSPPSTTAALDAQLPAPAALTSDASAVYAGTDSASASRLVVLSRTGDPARSIAVSGQPSGHTGGLSAAVKHGADVLVTDRSRAALLQINPGTGQQRVLATLPDLPACLLALTGTCQPGAQDLPPSPEGLAVIGAFAYVADAGQGTIWRYSFASKKLTAWYSSIDFSTGHGPSGLASDPGGHLVFTVAETGDLAALFKGALYRLAVGATAGSRTLLATFDSATAPGPVAVGRSGDAYVGLRSAGGVVVVHANGTVTSLITAAHAPAPAGLSLASGVLLVASRPAAASSGRVRSFSVSDTP